MQFRRPHCSVSSVGRHLHLCISGPSFHASPDTRVQQTTVLVTMIYGRLPGEHSTATVILTNAISTSENPILTSSEDWDQHPGPGPGLATAGNQEPSL